MELAHHGMKIVLDDDWWTEAGMADFAPAASTYAVDPMVFPEREIFAAKIDDIGPVHRAPGVGIFNDARDSGISARDRVVRILRGVRSDALIPPVEIVKAKPGDEYPYRLVAGTHRLYCSLAAGFTHVPSVEGFDINAMNG
jgi:hypothetical protein